MKVSRSILTACTYLCGFILLIKVIQSARIFEMFLIFQNTGNDMSLIETLTLFSKAFSLYMPNFQFQLFRIITEGLLYLVLLIFMIWALSGGLPLTITSNSRVKKVTFAASGVLLPVKVIQVFLFIVPILIRRNLLMSYSDSSSGISFFEVLFSIYSRLTIPNLALAFVCFVAEIILILLACLNLIIGIPRRDKAEKQSKFY